LILRSPKPRNAGVLKPKLKAAIAGLAIVTAGPALAEVPRQLYDKTIELDWSTQVVERDPEGRMKTPRIDGSYVIYVSSAGRLFERGSRSSGRFAKGGENAPGASQNRAGETRGLGFEANKLVGNVAFAQGAMRYVVRFDASYTSCTLEVTYGREAGGVRRRGVDGIMYLIESQTPSNQRCSIRSGNPFATQ